GRCCCRRWRTRTACRARSSPTTPARRCTWRAWRTTSPTASRARARRWRTARRGRSWTSTWRPRGNWLPLEPLALDVAQRSRRASCRFALRLRACGPTLRANGESGLDPAITPPHPPAMLDTPLLLLRNADVYAPEALGIRHLLVGGGRVLWMGEDDPGLPASLGAETADLEGMRLVPGFIDGHVHASGGGGEAGYASRVPAPLLSRYTRAGVTTVVGLLGTDDVTRGPAELLSHVCALREQGLSAWAYCGGYHLP